MCTEVHLFIFLRWTPGRDRTMFHATAGGRASDLPAGPRDEDDAPRDRLRKEPTGPIMTIPETDRKIVVLGAGITGLTAAWELSRSFPGRVMLLEKAAAVGGLAATC